MIACFLSHNICKWYNADVKEWGVKMPSKILIADDEKNIRELLHYNLELAGFTVLEAVNGDEAVSTAQAQKPELIILDIMMPVMDGLMACKKLKDNPSTRSIPIIMLTAKSEEADRVLGLELGADDYVVKPFGVRELVARVRALLRRTLNTGENGEGRLSYQSLVLDTVRYTAEIDGNALELTLKEFELLRYMMSHPGQVLTREVLLEKIWGYDYMGETRTVDVHVRHLRVKLGQYQNCIETVRGVGYRFVS
jgi:two-component system, OmpR family, alkaline phosphatase synthesis response regulator PhoP